MSKPKPETECKFRRLQTQEMRICHQSSEVPIRKRYSLLDNSPDKLFPDRSELLRCISETRDKLLVMERRVVVIKSTLFRQNETMKQRQSLYSRLFGRVRPELKPISERTDSPSLDSRS